MSLEKILIVEDERVVRNLLESIFARHKYSVTCAATLAEATAAVQRESFDLLMLDLRLPDGDGQKFLEKMAALPERPLVVMITGYGTVESAVACMRAGAFDYVLKPFPPSQIDVIVKKAQNYRQLLGVNRLLTDDPDDADSVLVGRSPAMQRLRQLIDRVAPTDATVLVTGESGTGKEMIAREFYRRSPRRGGAVAVSLAQKQGRKRAATRTGPGPAVGGATFGVGLCRLGGLNQVKLAVVGGAAADFSGANAHLRAWSLPVAVAAVVVARRKAQGQQVGRRHRQDGYRCGRAGTQILSLCPEHDVALGLATAALSGGDDDANRAGRGGRGCFRQRGRARRGRGCGGRARRDGRRRADGRAAVGERRGTQEGGPGALERVDAAAGGANGDGIGDVEQGVRDAED